MTVKATESDFCVPGTVVGLDYLEVSPPKLLHRMRQGLSALLAWQQTVLGKGLPKHLTVESSPLPFPSLDGKALCAVLKAMLLSECFC